MSCPMLLSLLPLWWTTGTMTLMPDEGLDMEEATFMLNQIITTIGYGSSTPRGSKGLLLFNALHQLVSAMLVSPVMYDLISYVQDRVKHWIQQTFIGKKLSLFGSNIGLAYVDFTFWFLVYWSMVYAEKHDEKGDLERAFYLTAITGTTVGYGDINPGGEDSAFKFPHHLLSPFLTNAFGNLQGAIEAKWLTMPTWSGKKPEDKKPADKEP